MALKRIIEKLEDVDEAIRPLYEPKDGKYQLQVDGVDDADELKRALEHERKERRDAKALLAKYKDLDPDEYQKLKQEHDDREMQSATKKGEFEKLKIQMQEKQQAELSAKDTRINKLTSHIQALMVDAEATRALAAAKGSPELLLPHVRSQVRVVEEDDRFVTKVVDKNGEPRIGGASGELMTIPQLVEDMRQNPVFQRAFDASGASGSGAPSGHGVPTGQDLSKLPPLERMNAARAQRK